MDVLDVEPNNEMTLLATFVRLNFCDALCVEEARQLAYTIFCTLDYLPESLRNVIWDRSRIIDEFVTLAVEGYLVDATPAHKHPDYWNTTIDRFMSGKLQIDHDFRTRLKQCEEAQQVASCNPHQPPCFDSSP